MTRWEREASTIAAVWAEAGERSNVRYYGLSGFLFTYLLSPNVCLTHFRRTCSKSRQRAADW